MASGAAAGELELRASQLQVQCYGVADGLPQGSVSAIVQHPDGDLLLGTNRGLVRFDGARGQHWLIDGEPVLPDLQIHRLAVDGDDAVWVGSFNGLFRIDSNGTRRWGREQGLPENRILGLAPGEADLLVGTQAGSVRLLRDAGEWSRIESIGSMRVHAFGRDDDGSVWLAAMDGLHRIAPDGSLGRVRVGAPGVEVFWSMAREADGTRWFGTRLRAYRRAPAADAEIVEVTEAEGLPALPIRAILADRNGNMWFASAGAGLFLRTGSRYERVPGLETDVVLSLAEDGEGNLWAGTSSGICRIRTGALLGYGLAEGLGTDFIVGLASDASGDVHVASNGRGLFRIDADTGSVSGLTGPAGDPFVNYVGRLDDGRVIAASNRGTAVVDGDRLVSLHPQLDRQPISWAADDAEGVVWLRGTDGILRLVGDRLEPIEVETGGARWAFRDDEGTVWISAAAGLFRARGEQIAHHAGLDVATNTNCQYRDHRGVIWCTATNAIVRVADGRAVVVRDPASTGEVGILALLPDDAGAMWLATTAGLLRVEIAALDALALGTITRADFRRFDERHGMRSSEFTRAFAPGIAARTPDGRHWWATMGGVLRTDPARLARSDGTVIPRIDALGVDGRKLPRSTWLDIPAGAAQLAIDFGAVSLGDAASVQLRHRLLPLAQDWTDGDARSFRAFALPGGDYRFEIEASIDRKTWQRTAIEFRIARHWHERWPVRIGLALLALALVVSLPLLRITAMRSRARELSALVDARTAALTAANLQLDRIARTDALTGVANRRSFDLALAATPAAPRALLLIDVDHFKAYNDRHGHVAGDACLVQVARAIGAAADGDGVLVARYGGEEFAVLCTGAAAVDAAALATRVRDAVRALAIPHADAPAARITVSVGVACDVAGGRDTGDLLADADRALYRAKAAGRDRIDGP